MNTSNVFAHRFLLGILLALGFVVLWMFQPFLINIILAATIASFFYPVYKTILKYTKISGIASFITTAIIALLVFGPFVNFFIYLTNRTIEAYQIVMPYLTSQAFADEIATHTTKALSFVNMTPDEVITLMTSWSSEINSQIIAFSTTLVRGTTSFFFSTIIVFLTIFYLFIDGKSLLRKLMNITPFPNKYDLQLFHTFRQVSYSTIVSTVCVALFQGIVGGLGFFIIGLPGFFAGVATAIMSVMPYIGSFLVWGPATLYLFVQGEITKAIILLITGVIISTGDNVIRAFIIKGRAQVHELLVFFSLIGGIAVFGFWGIVLGPLIFSLLMTVINIYEEEFSKNLEKAVD